MPRILFIAAHRAGRSPSQRYRFEQYFDFLSSKGYECVLSSIIDEEADLFFYRPGNLFRKVMVTLKSALRRWKDVRTASQFDIVFVQREAFMTGSSWFERGFAKSGAKLVFDFDDSIWLLDTSAANKRWEWLKSAEKTSKIISMSDLVFAGNEYLASYARKYNSNVRVMPTTIDTEVFKRKLPYSDNESICIGWSGSITTIKHFELAIPVLRALKAKYGTRVHFKVMGDAGFNHPELGIIGIPWTEDTEVDIISSFDIGIMPLPDDEWVKGKCGLKGLSYMSLEIPTVMSAVGVNPSIIKNGINGFLASSEEEWTNRLSELIESFELRKRLGQEGRKTVESEYSKNSRKNEYLESFNRLLKP
jgi:glycosyltransferase involved in cell wall biosynthesis